MNIITNIIKLRNCRAQIVFDIAYSRSPLFTKQLSLDVVRCTLSAQDSFLGLRVRKRENVTRQTSMQTDELSECYTLCAIKMKPVPRGGAGGAGATPVTTACSETGRWRGGVSDLGALGTRQCYRCHVLTSLISDLAP